jgi:hypothetical protein
VPAIACGTLARKIPGILKNDAAAATRLIFRQLSKLSTLLPVTFIHLKIRGNFFDSKELLITSTI